MKMLREADYRIQSTNKHLKNILEEDYYIELGCVDYKVLARLLAGEEIDISECIYNELASQGIGQISSITEHSLTYQLSYLIHLRQKSSSCKIFLTCNILRYYDKENHELYAPIVLIPISIDYTHGKIIQSSEVIPNKLLLKELESLTGLELTYPERIINISQIDNFSFELSRRTEFAIQIGNFLTYANVEYPDFKTNNELFDIERSIYELTPKEITDEYYQNVKAILPTNIQQKYVILKAAKDENFAVDGRLGSGKTYTILNIVADKIAKGKKVLYVNQDSDAIARFERELYKHHMGPFTHNFERIIPIEHQIELLLPELKNNTNQITVPQEIFTYELATTDKYHGLTYKQITEELAYLNNKYSNLEEMPIESTLEHFEINKVREALRTIENRLENIDPLKDNIWINIEDYYNRQHRLELVRAVEDYKTSQLDFNKYFFEFCTRYEIVNPDNFNDAHRLISDIKTFSITKVPPKWSNNKVYQEAKGALEALSQDIRSLNVLEQRYGKIVTPDYCKGDAEDILDTICYRHLNNKEDKYINQLLSPYSPLENIINDLRIERKAIRYASSRLEELLELKELPNNIYSFLTKIEHVLSHSNVATNWIKMFIAAKADHLAVNETLEHLISSSQELHEDILQYAIVPELFKYENLKLLTNNSNFEKLIIRNLDRKVMRTNKKSSDKLYQEILEFMDRMSEVIKVANKYQLLSNLKLGDFCDSYQNWIDFVKNLNRTEYEYLVALVQKNDLYYLLKNNNLLSIVSDFNEHADAIKGIFNHMFIYGIKIDGEGILEQLSNVDEWIDYLRRVIKCKQQLYKVYINNTSITYKDLIEVIEMDVERFNLFSKTEEKNNYYFGLLGEAYHGLYTECSVISVLMEHFETFQNKLVNKRHITSLLSTFGFKQMVEEYSALEVLSERVISAHRQFSRFFKGGQPILLECGLNKCVQIIRQYEVKISQLESIFEILECLRYFEKLGLHSIVKGIKNSEYKELLAERYIYSTYRLYRNAIIQKHELLQTPVNLLEYFEKADELEQTYCLNNISNLISIIPTSDKRLKDRRIVTSNFNDYNKQLENEYRNCFVFLANVDVFNSDLLLSSFDTIIIDDCHIASSNKYHRIEESKQILLFGDKSFRTSISNSLLNRVNPGTIVHYNRRYYPMNDFFKNEWTINNQYIYDFDLRVQITKTTSIKTMVEMIVHNYTNNPKPNSIINIVVFSADTRRHVYGELVNKLLENLDNTEVLKLLSTRFNIINGQNEDASYADDTIIFFDDIRNLETNNQELILRNFSCVADKVTIIYLESKDEIYNKETEALINNLMVKKTTSFEKNKATGIVKLIIDKMKEKGIKATTGIGILDIVIRNKNNTNIGIIIEGYTNHNSYYSLDDYQYYYTEYIKKGWQIFVFFMDDLINNLEKRISEVVPVTTNEKVEVTQLSFEDHTDED